MVLQFLFQLLAGAVPGGQDNGGLDHLAPDGVGGRRNGAFHYRRMLQEGAFHLKGPDAVAGALDDVVVAADEPVIPVGIPPGHVAGVVIRAAQLFLGHSLVFEIAGKQPHRRVVGHVHDSDGAFLAVRAGVAVLVNELDVVKGGGLAGGAGNRLEPLEIGQHNRRFALSEAFAESQAGQFIPLAENLRIQRLAGDAAVLDAGQVELGHILLKHKAVHGGGRAEGGHLIFGNHLKHAQRHKFVHIISKYHRPADPLAVNLAPAEFGPAGIGNAHMELVFLDLLPVFGSDNVA